MKRRGLIVLDRDGVLNRMVWRSAAEPVDSPLFAQEVEILPGVPETLRRLMDAGFTLNIASNQPAYAKGKVSLEDLKATHARVISLVQSAGARIQQSYICFHRAEDGCDCRKPRTGLLEAALRGFPEGSPSTSWMVGDRAVDVIAGATLGFSTALLGLSTAAEDERLAQAGVQPSFRGPDLTGFANFLLGEA
ncbi:MAG: HAD-IIIA family hydrolase [Polyangiaceae bacterium]|nr:HAD-IIIA family hydrolase [Polyangiaceae bacterium]